MKNPFTAPTPPPANNPKQVHVSCDAPESCIPLTTRTLTSEITAPADRSRPPNMTGSACPIPARARVAALLSVVEKS